MNIYPRNTAPTLDLELFRNPPAEYRGVPFWAWNGPLVLEQLLRQIETFRQMGFGGFHIHPRLGLETAYLGDTFMAFVKACVEQAERDGLRAWLYDEDRWPSGFAGGLVTSDPAYRAKHLLFTRFPYGSHIAIPYTLDYFEAPRAENGMLLARYWIALEASKLQHYERLADGALPPDNGEIWYAYLETAVVSPWFNHQTYVDTLSQAAIERFLAITHERYAEVVGAWFGTTIPAIFTDEPEFVQKKSLVQAQAAPDVTIPWTTDFAATYYHAYGDSVLDRLPELFWDDAVAPPLVRYRYHDHLAERFSQAYGDTIGAWCAEHGLLLTGHMMEEPTLQSQTAAVGEVMRALRSFDLPGIDLLADWREYTTAKQAQSVAHQYGRAGVVSELYGVTNWDFDFVGHKAQGDWQAALGVTVRVHHLAWLSMAGESKRDYPASIGYQSPWHTEYRLVEDYFARLNTVLTRGQRQVQIGVIHPIESFWLSCGPLDQTTRAREQCEQQFRDVTDWLLFATLDFDFIAESLLPSLCPIVASAPLQVGAATYDVVLVPTLRTIRRTTLERLIQFQAAGGKVIFAGEMPYLVDVLPSSDAAVFADSCMRVPFTREAMLDALEPFRDITITQRNTRFDSVNQRLFEHQHAAVLYQLRLDGHNRSLFCCNTDRQHGCATHITLDGVWQATRLDALTGANAPLPVLQHNGTTQFDWDFPPHGSLLVQLEPGAVPKYMSTPERRWVTTTQIEDPVPVTLSEPNVLLLDCAAYQLDDHGWQPALELLRLDTLLREQLDWPLRTEALAQPWAISQPLAPEHTLKLRWALVVDTAVFAPLLALEDAAKATIWLDGQAISNVSTGWWVDEAIHTVALPNLAIGEHVLEIRRPFSPATNLEWCYLLGNFGVELHGRYTRLVAPIRTLAFGDWTRQGLPFYAGNVTYHCTVATTSGDYAIDIADFKAPVLTVGVDGQAVGHIAFAPFQCQLGRLDAGSHELTLTAFGNRFNAFGALHHATNAPYYAGPAAWRTSGPQWTDTYRVRPMGILSAPQLLRTAVG